MMVPQTFSTSDLASVFALILLEGLLSADNALVMAIMVRHLPKADQQKALLYGLGGAFIFRLIAIVFASVVLNQWWLQALGALYLLYLPLKHFLHRNDEHGSPKAKNQGFWATVIAVELTDIAFALDSVLAGIGFIMKPGVGIQNDKIWVVYLGAVIGIVLLRFAAGLFIRLLERFPDLDNVAYLLVGWVGVKLAMHSIEKVDSQFPKLLPFHPPHFTEAMFWSGLAAIAIIGGGIAVLRKKDSPPGEGPLEEDAEVMESVQDLQIEPDEDEAEIARRNQTPD